jgi:O-antigen/teichoic acid export membrane protein
MKNPKNSGRFLTRNTIINFIGQSAPITVALFTIPPLIKALGDDRFGLLTIVWMILGYLSLLDLGIGRALTKIVAEKLSLGEENDIPVLVWTSQLVMILLGVAGAIAMAALSPFLVNNILNIPSNLRQEALVSFYLLACSMPIVISTTGFRGILEAQQLFGYVNAVRIPMGVFLFLGPFLVLPFSKNLVPIVLVLLVIRIIALIAYMFISFKSLPLLRMKITTKIGAIKSLLIR